MERKREMEIVAIHFYTPPILRFLRISDLQHKFKGSGSIWAYLSVSETRML